MREIKFTLSNILMFGNGKISTIRLGQKEYIVGSDALLVCDESGDVKRAIITKIEILTLADITRKQIKNDGFSSFFKLRAELESCYNQKISLSDVVTVVTFANKNGRIL